MSFVESQSRVEIKGRGAIGPLTSVGEPPFENPDPQGESSSRGSATQLGALSYISTRNQSLHPESGPLGGALTSAGENHHRFKQANVKIII